MRLTAEAQRTQRKYREERKEEIRKRKELDSPHPSSATADSGQGGAENAERPKKHLARGEAPHAMRALNEPTEWHHCRLGRSSMVYCSLGVESCALYAARYRLATRPLRNSGCDWCGRDG